MSRFLLILLMLLAIISTSYASKTANDEKFTNKRNVMSLGQLLADFPGNIRPDGVTGEPKLVKNDKLIRIDV